MRDKNWYLKKKYTCQNDKVFKKVENSDLARLFLHQINVMKNFANSINYDMDEWSELELKGRKTKWMKENYSQEVT